jgi:16S rRNA (cytosine967-C5)-methyltransferase
MGIARRKTWGRTGSEGAELQAACAEALRAVFVERETLDKAVTAVLRSRRGWDVKERGAFVTAIHSLVRSWRNVWTNAGFPDENFLSPLACTKPRLEKICEIFAGKRIPRRGVNIPDWLNAVGRREIGDEWLAVRRELDESADLFLRVNTLRAQPGAVIDALRNSPHTCELASFPGALRLTGRRDLYDTKPFKDGWVEVQDVNSQQVAPFLEARPGMRVVDACAGAGGKSLHLAALMRNKGRIVSLDVASWKLDELRRRAARAGADTIETHLVSDAKSVKRFRGTADRVLLDVPCSGLGVVRRNPDIKWKLTEEELGRLRSLQAQLLRDYSQFVKKGGKLVYATCSVLPSEGERQVDAFLAENPGWKLEEERRLHPGENGGDGFFMARLAM